MIDVTDIKKGINKMIDHGFKPRYLYINYTNYNQMKYAMIKEMAILDGCILKRTSTNETLFGLEIIVTELLSDDHFVISQFKLEDEEISDQEQMMEYRI